MPRKWPNLIVVRLNAVSNEYTFLSLELSLNAVSNEYTFLSLELSLNEAFSTIKRVPGVPYSYVLREGKKLEEVDFPTGMIFPISEESGDIIGDSVDNILSCFFVSSALKSFLCSMPDLKENIQFLPFNIADKKGLLQAENYYIANVLPSFDCFNIHKADFKLHPKTGKVWRIKTIEIDMNKVPSSSRIFRLGESKSRIILRSDLVDAINLNGFTGLSVFSMGATLP